MISSGIGVVDIVTYIPEHRVRLLDSHSQFGVTLPQAKIYEQFYKLKNIPISIDRSLVEFFTHAILKLINKYPDTIYSTKILINAHTSPVIHYYGTSLIRTIQQKFNFRNCMTIATTLNKCVASIQALTIAKEFLLQNHKDDTAIIITGEICYTNDLRHVPNTSVAGDGCAVVLLSRQKFNHEIRSTQTITDGKYSKGIWMSNNERASYDLQYVDYVASIIRKALEQNNLYFKDLALIIPHNINRPSWEKVAKKLKIDLNKIYLKNIAETSHILGADVFINLKSAILENKIKPGDKTLLASVGIGANYGYAFLNH